MTVQYENYSNYLRSDAWKEVKKRYKASDLPKDCPACMRSFNSSFHFHHKTYDNFGNEPLTDIVPMCAPCHSSLHKWHKKQIQEGKNLTLWDATELFCKSRSSRALSVKNTKTSKTTPNSPLLPKKEKLPSAKFKNKFGRMGGGRKLLKKARKLKGREKRQILSNLGVTS